jgi:hypothetical protein
MPEGDDARCVNPNPGGRRVERSTSRSRAAREDPREGGNLTRCSTFRAKASMAMGQERQPATARHR